MGWQHPATRHPRQRGTVLVVAIVLLLLASLITLFALNVGVFEQRASGNDVRAKLVQQVADSALAEGAEFIYANTDWLSTGFTGASPRWVRCGADETAFPCGAVPKFAEDGVTARRETMYRFSLGTADIFGGGSVDTMEARMLPLARTSLRVNNSGDTDAGGAALQDGFQTNYGVGAVLCRLRPQAAGAPATCSTTLTDEITVSAITLVAVADMGAEGARATAIKSFATTSTFGLRASQPPIMASGSVDITGTFQAVTSANGGGPGVPVTIWSRKNIVGQGTPDTCYADEFYRSGTPTWHPNATDENRILRCDSCDCSVGQLTKRQGQTCTGGRDILVGGGASDCSEANFTVQPSEFPCDLFEHIFGLKAREDDNGDFFCERLITQADPASTATPPALVGVDELYLAEKADWIVTPTTGFGARFASDGRRVTCANALTKTGALIWIRDSTCTISGTVGTPGAPVLIVYDGELHISGGTVFGLLFARSTGTANLSETTGGNAELKGNGNVAIYGAAIVQGVANKLNGTGAIIHDPTILGNLRNRLSEPDVDGLPGSWTDAVRY